MKSMDGTKSAVDASSVQIGTTVPESKIPGGGTPSVSSGPSISGGPPASSGPPVASGTDTVSGPPATVAVSSPMAGQVAPGGTAQGPAPVTRVEPSMGQRIPGGVKFGQDPFMNVQSAFREGFVTKLASMGLDPDQLEEALLKKAQGRGPMGAFVGEGAEFTADMAKLLAKSLLGVGIGLPPLIGAGLGYGMGKSRQTSLADIEAMKETALLNEYSQAIKRLNRQERKRVRSIEPATPTAEAATEV
jgi:hypothetical protein